MQQFNRSSVTEYNQDAKPLLKQLGVLLGVAQADSKMLVAAATAIVEGRTPPMWIEGNVELGAIQIQYYELQWLIQQLDSTILSVDNWAINDPAYYKTHVAQKPCPVPNSDLDAYLVQVATKINPMSDDVKFYKPANYKG